MPKQPSLNSEMRAILVDWLVEVQVRRRFKKVGGAVKSRRARPCICFFWFTLCLPCVQENFELYHETLYLAVKIADHYLFKSPVHREMLQLLGSTAMLIASKFEVRTVIGDVGDSSHLLTLFV